ncbi:MAG TPA: hypothetical protein VFL59_09315 [Candidatus Nanopelagicales bacterium]|nr:hypothetical protein [Candidatus Nanopelagicales bacterium]
MTTMQTGTYDEALERLHRTGPEWDGWMSNHGPMAVDVLARRNAGSAVHAWVEEYAERLDDLPAERRPIAGADDERDALGDPARLGDWIARFERAVEERPWEEVLADWWPRLLPGIAAGATHGVIRTGHAVLALRAEDNSVRRAELAQALGYWAGRWQPVPHVTLLGSSHASALVPGVPRIAVQEGGIRDRLGRLGAVEAWPSHVGAMAAPDDVPEALADLVDVVVGLYPRAAHGNPTMLVHAATAPHAVARTLPSLPPELWADAYAYAWSATAAVLSCYLPAGLADVPEPVAVDDAWDAALRHGGEHVLKLADVALDVHDRTGDPAAVAAITRAVSLDA